MQNTDYYVGYTKDGDLVMRKTTHEKTSGNSLIINFLVLLIFSLIPFTVGYIEVTGSSPSEAINALASQVYDAAAEIDLDSDNGSIDWETLQDLQSIADKGAVLKYKDEGLAVIVLQSALISLGYDCGSMNADGVFGRDTEDAVIQFQSDHSLEADGIVGVQTLKTLISEFQ